MRTLPEFKRRTSFVHSPFAFNLSLSVSFGEKLSHGGYSLMRMNDWIDDELAALRKQDDERFEHSQHLNRIQQHSRRIYDDIKLRIKDATDKLNKTEQLRQKIGGLECQDIYSDKIIVKKMTFPSIVLTVSPGPNSIDVHREIVTNGARPRRQEQKEVLEVDLDENGNPFLRNKEGVPMDVEAATHYLFRPFLHTELVTESDERGWSSRPLNL